MPLIYSNFSSRDHIAVLVFFTFTFLERDLMCVTSMSLLLSVLGSLFVFVTATLKWLATPFSKLFHSSLSGHYPHLVLFLAPGLLFPLFVSVIDSSSS